MAYTIDMPGAVESFYGGTGVMQGQTYSDDESLERGARELRAAWEDSTVIRRGKGRSIRLTLPSIEACVVLAEYAETCISANYGGDLDYAEVRAARALLERVERATAGRVAYNGFNVTLDGQRV